jgi:flagellar P-ring protein precursor FlgI
VKLAVTVLLLLSWSEAANDPAQKVRIRDITTVESVRDNPLIGYGIVAGLRGTGDSQQTIFTVQTLANVLQRLGVQIPPATARVNNVAAVFVTAALPPFSRPGTQLDVTVSSIGDAKSLEGGLLLLTPLAGADGQVYAAAQGPITVGGYTAGGRGTVKQINHPTVGRIPAGGIVERALAFDLRSIPKLSLLLTEPDYTTAILIAGAINEHLQRTAAVALDSRRVDVDPGTPTPVSWAALLADLENLTVPAHRRAKVVINERTGTIVMGKDVKLGAVSILHGNLSIEISTEFSVSQPNPLANGQTAVVPERTIRASEGPAKRVELGEGANVEQLVGGLQAIGATARDVIAVLQAIKAAGALDADLEVI